MIIDADTLAIFGTDGFPPNMCSLTFRTDDWRGDCALSPACGMHLAIWCGGDKDEYAAVMYSELKTIIKVLEANKMTIYTPKAIIHHRFKCVTVSDAPCAAHLRRMQGISSNKKFENLILVDAKNCELLQMQKADAIRIVNATYVDGQRPDVQNALRRIKHKQEASKVKKNSNNKKGRSTNVG